MRLGDDVIQRWRAAKWIAAICALVVPGKVDLITGRSPGDQPGFIDPVLIHRGPREG